jgi:hypothetical protein
MVDNRARCSAISFNSGYHERAAPDLDRMIGLTSHLGLDLKGTRP